jgi:hypothetical protein
MEIKIIDAKVQSKTELGKRWVNIVGSFFLIWESAVNAAFLRGIGINT